MEEDKGPVARVSPTHSTIPPPAEPSSSSNPPQRERAAAAAAAAAAEEEGEGLRFEVELRPGETTIVSWKKLLKEAGYGGGPPQLPGADPVLAAQPGPSGSVKPDEDDLTEKEPPTNRYSAVIEKIERLYMGKHSSDEEDLDDAPVDDQYDTEDSFIDDAELDEYFQVDKLVTKHNGYFVNKGKLEQIEPSSSPVVAPRKRRRKDSTHHEDHDHVPSEHVRIRRKRMNTVSRSELYMRKNLPSYGEEDGKLIDNKQSAPIAVYKKKSVDLASSIENPTYAKLQNKDVGALQSRDISEKSRGTNESYHRMYSDHPDKGVSCFLDFQSRKLLNGENEGAETKFQYKEKSTSGEFAERNISGSSYPLQAVSTTKRVREGAAIRPKGTRLERAIRDLEKIVAEIRPPSFDVQGADPAYQGVKRRLPPEVKQRLAKVARLTASKGKFSEDELTDRLMSIVGHLVHRKTLKRNMRELVELGLSAKQQKADRFEQIKREVYEMIKARISTMKSKGTEQQDGSTDDFQEAVGNEERRALKGRHSMDATLEDKICDLYDLYVEGMDEDKGPLSRKLYVELAELWPYGYMDNVGIKDAIYRSKERKGALYRQHKVRDEERLKRRRLAAAAKLANSAQTGQTRALQERQLINYTGQGIVSPEKTNTSNQPPTSTSKATTNPALPLVDQGSKYEGGNRNADASKKPKRNPEHELGEEQALSLKLPPQQHVKERQKSQKNTDEPNASVQPKASIQMSGLLNSDQPS